MKRSIILAAAFLAAPVAAQTACDVTYVMDVDIGTNNVSTVTTQVFAAPMADVLDNHAKGLQIINDLSKAQDRGGPYQVTVSETRSCDNGPATVVQDGGVMVKGVTLQDSNKTARHALQLAGQIVARYESRAAKGQKTGWDHSKAKPVKLDPNTGKKQ